MTTVDEPHDRQRTAVLVLVVIVVTAGLAIRLWIARTPSIGYLDSDEAVPGLMALHMLRGEIPTFYWGQNYGGTPEVGLLAAVFRVFGSSVAALRAVPIALYGLAALLLWRIGRRTIGEPCATYAALLFWIWPAYFVWRSTREYGYYGVLLVCGLGLVLVALRLREKPNLADAALAGALLGLGLWSSLQIVLVALPTLAWLVSRRPSVLRYSPVIVLVAGAVASAWIVANIHSGWASLDADPGGHLARSYGYRLGGFFTDGLPSSLGLRVLFTRAWLPTPTLGKVVLFIVCAALVVTAVRRRRSAELLLVILLPLPFLYAASGFTYNLIEPRYLGFLAALLALLVGSLLTDFRVAALTFAVAATLSIVALQQLREAGGVAPGAPDLRAPTSVEPVIRLLDRHAITRARANYWIAFRITFLTKERIIVAPTESARHPAYNSLVDASSRPARIFVTGTSEEPAERPGLLAAGYRPVRAGPFTVYLPSQ